MPPAFTCTRICDLAARLMRQPAVPYHERGPAAEVERICREQNLRFKRDPFGNIIIGVRRGRSPRPLVLAAHLDHPGFEIVRRLSSSAWLARFHGGVPDHYFRAGTPVRLFPGGARVKLGRRHGRDRIFELRSSHPVEIEPEFAVWDLVDFRRRSDRIYGRSCDDLAGVAAALAVLIELRHGRAPVDALAVISRAEEVGFQGALGAATGRDLPKRSLVVSLETSRELPGVRMGEGVIVRVGDRTSIFNSQATRFLTEVASRLQNHSNDFRFQRALMSGGTCEATAYQEFGFQTAAVCVALGNYHNCSKDQRIAAEFVNLLDVRAMVELLTSVAAEMKHFDRFTGILPQRLRQLLRTARARLRDGT